MSLAAWKLIKFMGVALFAAGLFGAFVSRSTQQRSVSAHWTASIGLILLWISGYGMMKMIGYKLSTIWIVVPILASLVAFGTALASVGPSRFRPWLGAVALSGFTISLIAMTFRTQPHDILLVTLVPVLFVGCFFWLRRNEAHLESELSAAKDSTIQWFIWIARLEGASLLFLLGVYMPLKYGAKIVLDGGQGWTGWVHGILQLIYIAGLVVTARLWGWSLKQTILGFFASIAPFGTFWFERKLKSTHQAASQA